MIIFRYLAKEVYLTLIALTAILMLIFMSNQFVQYLNRAASGTIPGVIILKLMALEIPNLMGLLLPLGFYFALLLAYGRLYADSEMTVLHASGYSPNSLLKHSFIMASMVAVLVGYLVIWLSPEIALARAKLLRSAGIQTLIQTIIPGRFHAVNHGLNVFYVQSMTRSHTQAEHVFLARRTMKDGTWQWDILWADKAFAEVDAKTGEDYLVLQNGKAYQGIPGKADYQVAEFHQYQARLAQPTIEGLNEDIRTYPTASLLPINNPDLQKAAELQWRFSVPIMVFVLTLIAVPLCRLNPRSGKYAKLLPAIIIYILYANFMFVARDAISSGKLPTWLGMWWLHALVFILGIFLLWRNHKKLAA
ncbi:MAG: LPS export ABC transporter permease LptF [Legionella sp.]|jgi:lipopolysaccharide export system permease protein